MGIGSTHDGSLEQSVVFVNGHQRLYDECNEAQVVLRCLAWSVQQCAGICRKTPVIVLAATVDAGKRFLMQQHAESMFASYFLHQRHQQHVMVYGEVGLFEDRCQLKLVWCHLVMAGLAGNGKL